MPSIMKIEGEELALYVRPLGAKILSLLNKPTNKELLYTRTKKFQEILPKQGDTFCRQTFFEA